MTFAVATLVDLKIWGLGSTSRIATTGRLGSRRGWQSVAQHPLSER